jgi:hypothetical protein
MSGGIVNRDDDRQGRPRERGARQQLSLGASHDLFNLEDGRRESIAERLERLAVTHRRLRRTL